MIMRKIGVVRLAGLLSVIAFVLCFYPAEANSLKVGDLYQTKNGRMAIEVISSNQVEISWGKDIFLGEYGFKRGKLRIVYGSGGMTRVEYYDIVENGLKDDEGVILYSTTALKNTVVEKQEEWDKAQENEDEATPDEMVYIKGACFEMGDMFDVGTSDEKPVHRVCLDDFKMDKYETAQAAFKKVMDMSPSRFRNCPECPVENVTWFEAKEYCKKVDKRLPAAAEWEYAAREGGKKVKYGMGQNNVNCSIANFSGCGGKTKPVGSYAPNGLGLYDMAGNVWEWTADRYDKHYYKKSPDKNPKGPASGRYRTLRGGSWSTRQGYLRVSNRYSYLPGLRFSDHGFRCAQ